jgi:hypothetical protein
LYLRVRTVSKNKWEGVFDSERREYNHGHDQDAAMQAAACTGGPIVSQLTKGITRNPILKFCQPATLLLLQVVRDEERDPKVLRESMEQTL